MRGVDHGAVLFNCGEINLSALQQFLVSEEQLSAVQRTREPVPRNLVHFAEPRPLYVAAVGLQYRLRNGVRRDALSVRRKCKQFRLAKSGALRRMNADHAEFSPGQCTGLVKDQRL